MGRAIGEILPAAVGVAISPVPIIAVILMLISERARANSVSFLLGWIAGLAVVGAVVLAIGGGGSFGDRESTGSGVTKLVFGVILLLLAVRRWRSRHADTPPRAQRWLSKIERFTAAKSFVLAAALAGLNPKNLALTAAAALSISAAGLSVGGEIGSLAVFIAIGTCTVAAPVLVYVALGKRADEPLERMRGWLAANNSTITSVLLLVFGAKLTGDGIAILA